jgi:hypothetical protein
MDELTKAAQQVAIKEPEPAAEEEDDDDNDVDDDDKDNKGVEVEEEEEEEEEENLDDFPDIVDEAEDNDEAGKQEVFEYDMSPSGRLNRCGFSSALDGTVDELRGGGLLVVKCLTQFLLKHKETAPVILAHAARRSSKKPMSTSTSDNVSGSSGEGGVSVGAVCVQCLRSVATVLRLTPTPTFSDVSAASVARTAVWRLLDYPLLVENMFALALHIFDDQTTVREIFSCIHRSQIYFYRMYIYI